MLEVEVALIMMTGSIILVTLVTMTINKINPMTIWKRDAMEAKEE